MDAVSQQAIGRTNAPVARRICDVGDWPGEFDQVSDRTTGETVPLRQVRPSDRSGLENPLESGLYYRH